MSTRGAALVRSIARRFAIVAMAMERLHVGESMRPRLAGRAYVVDLDAVVIAEEQAAVRTATALGHEQSPQEAAREGMVA